MNTTMKNYSIRYDKLLEVKTRNIAPLPDRNNTTSEYSNILIQITFPMPHYLSQYASLVTVSSL